MDASNVVSFLEGKRKQFAESGTLIPILVVASLVVVGLVIFLFTGSDSTNGDKPVSVVVNLNERRKMSRRDPNDVVTPERKPKKKVKPPKVETPPVTDDNESEDDSESTDTEDKPTVEDIP